MCVVTCFLIGLSIAPMVVMADASPYGVCAHFDNPLTMRGTNTYWIKGEETAKLMCAAGIRNVRIDLPWAACSKKEGEWDYTRTDKAVDVCTKNGLEPLGVLAYSTVYADPAHEYPEKWREYVQNIVGRYKDRVHVWEVWNEENCGFWKPHPDAHVYGKFLKLTYETIKSVDPTAKVAMGGTTGVDLSFIGTLQKDGMNRYFDICCVHPYFDPYDPERRVEEGLAKLRVQLDASGDAGKPIWVTEFGMPTAPLPNARNTGNIAAGIEAVGRADTPMKVLYWHGARDGKVVRDDDPFLFMYKRDFPKGSTFDVVGLESFPARLKQGGYDAIVLVGAESYPGEAQHQIASFVRKGGLLVCVGGGALWYPVRVDSTGKLVNNSCEQYNSWWLRNSGLRFELDVWFLNKKIPQIPNDLYKAKPTVGLWKRRPNEQYCHRFFRPSGLKEGDRWIPLLQAKMVNGYVADGVVAVKYGSDMKGALILSGIFEPQGCRICSPERQAKVLARAQLIALSCGVEKTFWYEFVAHENDDGDSEEHFGIVHRDLSPKPAYVAFKTLSQCRPAGSCGYGSLTDLGHGIYSPRWKLPCGKRGGALWNLDNPGCYRVRFRCETNAVKCIDVFGNVTMHDMNDGVVEMRLDDGPIYYFDAEIENVESVK